MNVVSRHWRIILVGWLALGTVGLQAAVARTTADPHAVTRILASDKPLDYKLDAIGGLAPGAQVIALRGLTSAQKSALWTRHFERWLRSGLLSPDQDAVLRRALGEINQPNYFSSHMTGPLCSAFATAFSGDLGYKVTVALGSTPGWMESYGPLGKAGSWAATAFQKAAQLLVTPVRARSTTCTCSDGYKQNCCPTGCACDYYNLCDNFGSLECGCMRDQQCTGLCDACGA